VKKKEIYFGKGFKRIYFVIAGLWLCIPLYTVFTGNVVSEKNNITLHGLTWTDIFQMTALPFVIYFVLLFIIKGFRK